jgi:hypothetical protein
VSKRVANPLNERRQRQGLLDALEASFRDALRTPEVLFRIPQTSDCVMQNASVVKSSSERNYETLCTFERLLS